MPDGAKLSDMLYIVSLARRDVWIIIEVCSMPLLWYGTA